MALAAPDRQFSYSITRGDASRFAVGAADGSLRYIGSGENAEQTPEYLLTVTATPHDSGAVVMHLAVRVAIVDADDRGVVVLSTLQPYLGEHLAVSEATASAVEVIGQRFAPMTRPARWGVWGSGDVSQFGGDFDGFRQDGTVLSGYLGADYRFVPNALAGLAASYSSLDLTSTSEVEGKATLTGSLVNVYPYGLWMPEEWLGIWGIAGFGTGTSDLTTVGGGIPEESLLSWLGAATETAANAAAITPAGTNVAMECRGAASRRAVNRVARSAPMSSHSGITAKVKRQSLCACAESMSTVTTMSARTKL